MEAPKKQNRAIKIANGREVLNLPKYTSYYLTAIYNKLTSGASQIYREKFDIGIVDWRLMATLASEPQIPASKLSRITNIDKGSISKSLQGLHERGIVDYVIPEGSLRKKLAYLTEAGLALHDQILPIALGREQTLLAGLEEWEVHLLFEILEKMTNNLPDLSP